MIQGDNETRHHRNTRFCELKMVYTLRNVDQIVNKCLNCRSLELIRYCHVFTKRTGFFKSTLCRKKERVRERSGYIDGFVYSNEAHNVYTYPCVNVYIISKIFPECIKVWNVWIEIKISLRKKSSLCFPCEPNRRKNYVHIEKKEHQKHLIEL